MKTSSQVTADKLRGGFYSPEALVKVCLDRARSLLPGDGALTVLEPSAGDGAFLAGLASHALGPRVAWSTAVEIVDVEAAAIHERLTAAPFDGEVINDSVLRWALQNERQYDLAVGNPPFVRFQFVDDAERAIALALGGRLGAEFKGVSNLWLPVLVSALGTLRPGGVFAFIVPAESFTGVSGHEVREWLLDRVECLNVDLFSPGSFPGVLQEVIVLSGKMAANAATATRSLHLREHSGDRVREWTHTAVGRFRTWTRFLLSPDQVESLSYATQLNSVTRLGSVAKFEVATVTGANAFFCITEETVRQYDLSEWTVPLLPRTRHAAGLAYASSDHDELVRQGKSGFLLDFAADRPDPLQTPGASSYLALGEDDDLPSRYKCRIRTPWYRVPVVHPGAMLMAKRSHLFPRVIVNDAQVVTTDTIYRGRILPDAGITTRELTASFHNSLTLLTAEIEGRSFGGGVLELVPSEISNLSLPRPERMDAEFDRLDWVCRQAGEDADALVEETDRLLVKKTSGLTTGVVEVLAEALHTLRALRLSRN